MFEQFNKTVQFDLNAAPPIHATRIVTRIEKDASITGFGDVDGNGSVDATEPKLFKLEFDGDNGRIIVTAAANDAATGRSMPRGVGFFAGVMIGSLMSRQTAAGVQSGHCDRRAVAGAPIGQKVASSGARPVAQGSAARSGAHSGGLRGGK